MSKKSFATTSAAEKLLGVNQESVQQIQEQEMDINNEYKQSIKLVRQGSLVEGKTERVVLLLQPTVAKTVKQAAKEKQLSVNEFVSQIFKEKFNIE